MKNREKFREEILLAFVESFGFKNRVCDFMKKHIIPNYDMKEHVTKGICNGVSCQACSKMFAFWLDEEYIEPPKPEVDWSKVPVDTLVRVKDDEEDTWALRYFCEWDGDTDMKYRTFPHGTTSKTTTYYYIENWKYCELVEDEDE